jgi:hydrogenase maturation protease
MPGILICGAGNRNNADDGIGPASIDDIGSELKADGVTFLDLGSSPQDFAKEASGLNPDRIVIITSIDMGKTAGSIGIIGSQEARKLLRDDGKVGLEMFIIYVERATEAKVDVIGVQPWSRRQNHVLSPEARNAMTVVKQTVKEMLLH